MRFTLLTSVVALAVLTAATPQPAGRTNGIAIPIIKRSGLVNADNSVNFDALNAHVASIKAKILRGSSNFEMNTGAPHPSVLKDYQRRATGDDPLTDDNSELWYGPISVGTPLKTFTVDFDTGSSDLFLPGPSCGSSCSGHTIYNPSASSTSNDLDQTFTINYGYTGQSSSVSGELFSDTVNVAGLTATTQTLGVASQFSSNFAANQFPADGLLGLAFESLSAFHASPVFQTLDSEGQTDQPVFSFKLGDVGELYLGGANTNLYTGSFSYTPVTIEAYWQVTMNSIEGNGQTILNNIDCIIDTGTTLVVGVPTEVAQLYQAIGGKDIGNGQYTFPCDSFPSVSFTFGGRPFSISAETLNTGPVSSGSSDCLSGIIGQDTGHSFWVVGDVFLRNVYTTFDFNNGIFPQVGFATLA